MSRFTQVLSSLRHTIPIIRRGGFCFSQYGEDFLVSRLFNIPRDCFYVDVGAAYPVKHSNTFRFYLRGGSGLTIEPNPLLVSQHRKVRPRDTCISTGVSSKPGKLRYHRFETADYNTFDPETAESVRKKGVRELDSLEVETYPLAKLLEEYVGEKEIDLMSIDCEGLDLDVIRSSDWQRFRPKVLIIEDHDWSFGGEQKSPIYNFVSCVGYQMISRLSYTSIFSLSDN